MSKLPSVKDELSLHIKILNCRDLLIGDTVSSDPYVLVALGNKRLHKTKRLIKTLNPTFGTDDDNECDVVFSWGDLTKKGGLTLKVKDWDLVGKDDPLGYVKIAPSEVLRMAVHEAPTTLNINPPPNMKTKKDAGTITLCIRHTSTTGIKSKYWAPPRASFAARLSLLDESWTKDLDEINQLSLEDEETSYDGSKVSTPPDHNKELIIEIVSCKNLIAGDANGLSDPYVKVRMGTRFLHRTKKIKNTLNPAFTAEHKNAFILHHCAKDLWAAGGIEFLVKDHDNGINALGYTNDKLGSAKVSARRLYQATSGVDMTLKLTPPADSKQARRNESAGSITIRVREATLEDMNDVLSRSNSFNSFKSFKSRRNASSSSKSRSRKFIPPDVDISQIDKKILLVEILSCRELLAADKNGFSDPYVVANMGFKAIHRTGYIKRTLNPVFTAKQKNSFVVDCSVEELYASDGMLIKVIDWDLGAYGGDELGSVQISAQTMYECQEEEYHLDPPSGRNDDPGFVTIRITEISEEQRKQHKRGKLKSPAPPDSISSGTGYASFSQLSAVSLGSHDDGSFTGYDDNDSNPNISASFDLTAVADKILLVEILSCRNLLSADKNGLSDPYVRVKMGRKHIHKTDRILKTLNPVFTSKQNNSFVISCPRSELVGTQGILVKVIDWDRGIEGDDDLGWVQIQAESLYECRIRSYRLNPPPGVSEDAGHVTIRTTEISEEERLLYKSKLPAPPPPKLLSSVSMGIDREKSQQSAMRRIASTPGMRTNLNTGVRTIPAQKIDILLPDQQNQTMLKPPPFDPDAKIIAAEKRTFRFLVAAAAVSSIVVVVLTATGITGRTSGRSGDPTIQIDQIGSRNHEGDPLKKWRGGRCVDIAGWTDSYGYGCDYYIENEDDCDAYADSSGTNGMGPMDACCVCQNAPASCVDLANWRDFYYDSCDWYEENEPVGCPNEGHVNGTSINVDGTISNVDASEACCHCQQGAVNNGGDI